MPKKLLDGFKHFKKKAYKNEDSVMPRLARQGQNPRYFIIGCIDSRANPAIAFGTNPGDFFSHKSMGAIVREYKQGTALAAALQFALEYNKVKMIIVMGHTQCGAIDALINGIDDKEISSFLNVAQHGLQRAKEKCTAHSDLHSATEEQIVLESLENLHTYPSVIKALEKQSVEIKGWVLDMKEGEIKEFNPQSGTFEKLT